MNNLLTRDAILTADDIRFEEVPVPEWGGTVRVRSLIGSERDEYEAAIAGDGTKPDLTNLRARLVAKAVVDEAGKRVFSDADVAKLGMKNAAALNRVFDVVRALSGLTKEDVEALAGNSDAAQSGSSTSGSPDTSA